MELLTIGKLAKQAKVNRETVRYYERRRLLPRASRSATGYRVFADDALRRLRFIRQAKVLGFSLNEIRELLTLRVNSIDTCDRVRERTELKIANIERKISSQRPVSFIWKRDNSISSFSTQVRPRSLPQSEPPNWLRQLR
jgi:DNA-binding transcriptional MerR regulator